MRNILIIYHISSESVGLESSKSEGNPMFENFLLLNKQIQKYSVPVLLGLRRIKKILSN